jgi:hypothetical protein
MHTPGLKIGLFGIGLNAYWEQFEGLKKDWTLTLMLSMKS